MLEFNYSIPIIIASIGLLTATVIFWRIMRYPHGDGVIWRISQAIHSGAMLFIGKEYRIMTIFAGCLFILLWIFLSIHTAIAFAIGACSSALAGFVGMYTATKANVRTTVAALSTPAKALTVAFFGGSIMGLAIASLGLLGLGTLYLIFVVNLGNSAAIHGFGMGASTVALFARVGGGIYTKSADIGADLVGKLESQIPEDDPRNPGVIADNVGDNVGDVAGMGSDIFESYCGSIIATIAIASVLPLDTIKNLGAKELLMFLPLLLASIGLISSIIGIIMVRFYVNKKPNVALRIGTISSAIIFMSLSAMVIIISDLTIKIWYAILLGAIGGIIIGLITEYYTSGAPVRKVANAGKSGAAPVIIAGLAFGMQSVIIPIITICIIILLAVTWLGLYGVGISAVGMLATVAMTMAIDAYGPIADNAGGIAAMGKLGAKPREITDSLDSLGNTTAAIGKGFAIGAAALAALAIITAYIEVVATNIPDFTLKINNVKVLTGLFIGGILPFSISSITMFAVFETASKIITEIRRQFSKTPIQDTIPDYKSCIAIATSSSLCKMILPGSIAVAAPIIVAFTLGAQALGGMLAGGLLSCVLLALTMANTGAVWDNAKKYIEQGNLGGKNTSIHAAVMVGDMTGDPLKDTSGPAMNILINVMAIVSLVMAPLLNF